MNTSCTRAATKQSQITIQVPTNDQLSKATPSASMLIKDGKKICFAVNVVGDGISQSGTCGHNVGIFGGFVDQGQSITVSVARGTKRVFTLLGSLVDSAANCPSQSEAQVNPALWANIYTAGTAADITLDSDEKIIEIPVSLDLNSIGAISGIAECGGQPGIIRAALLSSGIIVDSNSNRFAIDDSSPFWESISYGIGVSNTGWSYVSTSQAVALRADSWTAPTFLAPPLAPFVHSLTQRPGTREFYALQQDGQMVSVDPSTGAISEITTCPLEACRVPAWIQSISVGSNQKVFGLDHGGNIYEVKDSSSGPSVTYLRSVSPIVSQVVFY